MILTLTMSLRRFTDEFCSALDLKGQSALDRRGAIDSVHQDHGLDHSAALALASVEAIDDAGARSHVRVDPPSGCRVL